MQHNASAAENDSRAACIFATNNSASPRNSTQEIGLQQYLAPNISIPVEVMDLATVMDFPRIPELKHPERQSQCLAAIGAALRDEAGAAAA